MKRRNILIIAILAIAICVTATIFTLRKTTAEPARDKVDALCFYYLNLDQIAKKGAFDTHFSAEQRKLIASVLKTEVEKPEMAQQLESIITDINNSGIDFTKPIYCYMDSIESGYVFVAEVLSDNQIGKSLKLLSALYDIDINLEEVDGIHYAKWLNNIAIGYTDDRFIAVVNSKNSDATLAEALTKNLADLTIFGESDMASYINLNKALNAIETSLNEPTDATTTTQCQQLIADFRTRLTPEANILTTATFESGRATIDQRINGADLSGYNEFFHKGENNHLNYLSNNVIAVANLGINGTTLAELFNEIISNETVRRYANFGNEMAIYFAVANDVMESIKGDVTIALETLDGKIVEKVDYYWGGTQLVPSISDLKASVMVDVADSYIISNIPYFTMGMLRKVGDNHYNTKLGNYNFTLQQNESGLLFAGVNTKLEPAITPVTEKMWATELENSLGYIVVDFDNLTASTFIESASTNLLDSKIYTLYNRFTPILSYGYVAALESDHNQLVISFDNQQENALKQLSDLLLPLVLDEINKTLF